MFNWIFSLLPNSWQTNLIKRGVALALDDFRRKNKLGKYRVYGVIKCEKNAESPDIN